MYCVSLFIATRVTRVAQLRRARNRVATGLPHSSAQNPIFPTEKNDPHIRIPAAFPGPG
jgi:hypothetical protein